ncbi:hypothetical protein CGZ93_12440 [Enemella dayhoffiae]|uniref:DUF4192 domain-containing protein n=1 Tax=Enemella dayhoffiae TaxID=2016507 RepID=A0A255H2V2_9ACTN|nr:DUF4192 domain-containing protein [Enemella dayhoffiae]OYO21004.1 hypothetical protein CGZ93_12440 [Enemella dayhoffiae]
MSNDVSLVAQSPEEVLCAVPYLLGFHPEDSLVVVALCDRRVLFTARVDLELAVFEAPRLRDVVLQHGAQTVLLLAFAEKPNSARSVLGEVVDRFGEVDVADALISDGRCWWSLYCDDEECCPATGTAYDVSASRFAAEAVAAGLPALRSRSELAEQVGGPGRDELAAVRAVFEEVLPVLADWDIAERQDRVVHLVERFEVRRGLPATDCAELAVLCHDPLVRDQVLLRMRRCDAQRHLALWTRVVSVSAAPFEVAPLCLLALAAWLSGNGALQVVCMERAEKINPGFSLLGLLNDIHDHALAPSRWDALAA